jgi:hypothetical protein
MTWPPAFVLGVLTGLAIMSFFARRLNDEARDIEWRSGWVTGARAILRARLPGAKPLTVPPGVLPSMLDVREPYQPTPERPGGTRYGP